MIRRNSGNQAEIRGKITGIPTIPAISMVRTSTVSFKNVVKEKK
jgi:hypothetical protein